jgi:peptidoglycan-associated lipoprotein
MFFRFLMMFAVLVTVSACSKKDPSLDSASIQERQDITAGPLDGTEIGGAGAYTGEGPMPGTQQDLVVNVGDRVFFGYDQYDLTPEAQRTLEMQAEWLKRYPNVNIQIAGHCDERGTREYNLALGDRRANAVKSYLVALGVPTSRISTISYGKERPAVLGDNPSAWAQNRRGVTEVQ